MFPAPACRRGAGPSVGTAVPAESTGVARGVIPAAFDTSMHVKTTGAVRRAPPCSVRYVDRFRAWPPRFHTPFEVACQSRVFRCQQRTRYANNTTTKPIEQCDDIIPIHDIFILMREAGLSGLAPLVGPLVSAAAAAGGQSAAYATVHQFYQMKGKV